MAEVACETQEPSIEISEAEIEEVETTPILTTPIISEVHQIKIESKNEDIKIEINNYLDQISKHPELTSSASSAMITRAFPRLKQKTIEQAIESGYVSGEQNHDGKKRFSPTEIAILLYLCDHGRDLHGRSKKDIKKITTEELNKRQSK